MRLIFTLESKAAAPQATDQFFVIFRAELFRFLSTTYVNGM